MRGYPALYSIRSLLMPLCKVVPFFAIDFTNLLRLDLSMSVKNVFVWMVCLCGQVTSQGAETVAPKNNQIVDPQGQRFAELTSEIKENSKPVDSYRIMLRALEKEPEIRQVFLKKITTILAKLSQEDNTAYKKFCEIESKLHDTNKSLTESECKQLVSQIKLSNLDRVLFAEHCWEKNMKEFSYDVAFNSKDKKRFGNYANEIKECVVNAEKNPFKLNNYKLWNAMLIRNLWSAFANYIMCYDADLNSYVYSQARPMVVGMMTLFGESKMREWVTDLDRRRRWLDHPIVVGSYFFQQGKEDEAFAYFEDAGLMETEAYNNLCIHSGRFDKLIHHIESKDRRQRMKELPYINYFALAFAAQQVGDDDLYNKNAKLLFDAKIDVSRDYRVTQQIQRFLALSNMPKALEMANHYKQSEDVFKLLCLSYKYEMAHQYVQIGKLIDPEGIKPAEKLANTFFANINHHHAKVYNAKWKPVSYKKKYISPSDKIRKAMSANEVLNATDLHELNYDPKNKSLELEIVEYLMKGKFSGSFAERKFLDRYGKHRFLSEFYHKRWGERHYRSEDLFLAGHYAQEAGEVKLGDRWMIAACVMSHGVDYQAQDLVNAIKSVNPEYPMLEALRKISRRNCLYDPGGRQCHGDAFNQEDYRDAARTWNADHVQTLCSSGSSYGKHWWAWHNNAHDDEALGFLAIKEGNLDKAYEHLQKVWVVSENRYQLAKNLYFAYIREGNIEKAQSIYDFYWSKMEKIYKQTPNYYWALSHLVRWSLECRNPMDGNALKYAEKLRKMRGDRYFETRLLAEHHVLNKQPQKAREVLEIWMERRPRDEELSKFLETLKLPVRTLRDDGTYFGAQAWF